MNNNWKSPIGDEPTESAPRDVADLSEVETVTEDEAKDGLSAARVAVPSPRELQHRFGFGSLILRRSSSTPDVQIALVLAPLKM